MVRHEDDELDPEVAERLEEEMAPIEENERQRLSDRFEEEVAAHLARRRDELAAEGVDDEELEDRLSDEETDLRAEKGQEIEEELRQQLAGERRLRLSMILKEVDDESGDE